MQAGLSKAYSKKGYSRATKKASTTTVDAFCIIQRELAPCKERLCAYR